MNGFIDWSSLVVQAVNIAIVITVLSKFVFKPYLAHIDAEMETRKSLEEKTRSSDELLKAAKLEADKIIDEAKSKAQETREEARALAKQEASLVLFEANKEADAVRSKGLADVENERTALESGMKTRILEIAIKLNSKLFNDAKTHEALLEKFAKDL